MVTIFDKNYKVISEESDVDFDKMTDRELKEYFLRQKNKDPHLHKAKFIKRGDDDCIELAYKGPTPPEWWSLDIARKSYRLFRENKITEKEYEQVELWAESEMAFGYYEKYDDDCSGAIYDIIENWRVLRQPYSESISDAKCDYTISYELLLTDGYCIDSIAKIKAATRRDFLSLFRSMERELNGDKCYNPVHWITNDTYGIYLDMEYDGNSWDLAPIDDEA